jgi:urease accessory protein
MTPSILARTLQLMDSLFPVGAFAYSDGLESAALNGIVGDGASLSAWLDHYINNVFVPCDGLALLKSARARERGEWAAIRSLDEELTALRPAASIRGSGRVIRKRLLTTYVSIQRDPEFAMSIRTLPHCNAPVAYGLVLSHCGLECPDALVAFGYARLAGMTSAGLRLLSVGQQQGQVVLTKAIERLPWASARILESEAEPLRSFTPLLDIQQMNHQYIYSRLFRS